jgi:hypothetical protein
MEERLEAVPSEEDDLGYVVDEGYAAHAEEEYSVTTAELMLAWSSVCFLTPA